MILPLHDPFDDSLLLVNSDSLVAAQSQKDAADTTAIILATGSVIQVKESTEQIMKLLAGEK